MLIVRQDTGEGITRETPIHQSTRTVQLLSYSRLSLSERRGGDIFVSKH